jgi:hypothetical protein
VSVPNILYPPRLAIGAAGVHLGPRAFALAADLNKAKGLI